MRYGWTTEPFEECLEGVKYTRKIKKQEFKTTGKFPIISQEADFINGYWDDAADVFKIDGPLLAFGDHTQVVKYIDFNFVLGADGVKLLKPKKSIDPRYFYYFLLAHPMPTIGYARHYRLLRELTVSYPSLREQQQIVAVLDETLARLATATSNIQKNIKNTGDLFESYLNSVFVRPNKGWTICPLADCVDFITYGFTNPMPTTDDGPWMVTAKNIIGGEIDYNSARHTLRAAFENLLTDKSRPKVGDVLLTKDGTLGRTAVVDRDGICINQSVALLKPNGRMVPQFMKWLLSSRTYQDRMIEDAGGATIKHIYITRVDKMDVEFPASVDEQKKIVAELDATSEAVRQLETVYGRKITCLSELKQAVLRKAFSGELSSAQSLTTHVACQ